MPYSLQKIWSKSFVYLVLGALLNVGIQQPAAAEPPQTPICAMSYVPLTSEEQRYAETAWQYFVKNYQPKTGWVNAVDSYPSTSMWDLGNYLMALHSARSLNLITQADFDHRLNQFLTTLSNLKLFENTLPNKTYNTATGAMVNYANQPTPTGIGWSALDIGRMLTALHLMRSCHPQYEDWIQSIVSKWQLKSAIAKNQLWGATLSKTKKRLLVQEGRLGYEEYAARGFQLWGWNPTKALDRKLNRRMVEVNGLKIPADQRDFKSSNASNYVVSESYILHGLEFGFDEELANIAATVLDVQKRRYESTGKLTAVSEDHIKGAPHFLYSTIYANGTPWATITETNKAYPQLRTVSTKAAFGWRYLYPNHAYAQQVFAAVKDLRDRNGFFAGIFERNNQPNQILTTNTNALVLEVLAYKAQGNRPFIEPTDNLQFSGDKSLFKSAKPSRQIMLGAYTKGYLGTQSIIDRELNDINRWSGKQMSIAGLFTDLEDPNPAYNIPNQLETLRRNGYTAFVNFSSRRSAAAIANGEIDPAIRKLAQGYAAWIKQGSGRMALIAPLPEMNGSWESYREDPANYKRSLQRIQRIFAEAGVSRQSVRWVFAPNGWSQSAQHRFENYYPGDAAVDVVAFSGYNWGFCQNAAWKQWSSPKEVFEPYIKRLRSLAPNKPIFIAQTATTSYTRTGSVASAKDDWFRQSYQYLASAPGVRGILYFNLQKECDWALYQPNGAKNQGYKEAVANPAFEYISPQTLSQQDLRP
jgi:Protein of unknown function (DUF3131)